MLVDTFHRTIDYMRISVTKECNFRCAYCMPDTPEFVDNDALPLSKMLTFIKLAIDNGIKKLRITGGEPLLRKDLSHFIAAIHAYAPFVEITLTTNGFLLSKYIKDLSNAGLSRINISLDSLKKEKIMLISKRDGLAEILRGIAMAQSYGLIIKLNMVPLKGINDDEILDMLEFARERECGIRFIEFMENIHAKDNLQGLSAKEILDIIQTRYKIKEQDKECFGPAKLYSAESSAKSTMNFGIISPHEDDFCKSCNRIRLTSDGVICPCLYYQDSVNVKEAIMQEDKVAMQRLLALSVQNKPEKNEWNKTMSKDKHSTRAFYYTGG